MPAPRAFCRQPSTARLGRKLTRRPQQDKSNQISLKFYLPFIQMALRFLLKCD
jgi:hypothetical protein